MESDGPVFLAVEPEIETALNAGGVGIWRWRIGSADLGWTRNLEAIHRLPPGTFDGTFGSFSNDIDPTDLERVMDTINYSIATGQSYEIRYRNRPPHGIEPIWIEARGEIVSRPDGERYMTGVCQNVTERMKAQKELERRLSQQQAVSGFGTFALSQDRFDDVVARAVDVMAGVLGVPMVALLELNATADALFLRAGIGWGKGVVGSTSLGLDPETQAGYALRQKTPVIVDNVSTDKRFPASVLLRKHKVKSGVSVVIPGEDGRPFGILSVHTTERRRFDAADAEFLVSIANIVATSSRHARISERREIVIREMAHRSGNMLQLVQSLYNQTVAPAQSDPAAETFRSRLAMLAGANFLLAQDGWTQTRMQRLVETALGVFADRVETSGRDVLLPADLAFDLSLVLHELTTNSAKYGTLAGPGGRIQISWETSPDGDSTALTLKWADLSPQPAGNRAKGTGFGAKLIRMLVERKWAGQLSLDESDGYRFSLSLLIPNRLAAKPAAGRHQKPA